MTKIIIIIIIIRHLAAEPAQVLQVSTLIL